MAKWLWLDNRQDEVYCSCCKIIKHRFWRAIAHCPSCGSVMENKA